MLNDIEIINKISEICEDVKKNEFGYAAAIAQIEYLLADVSDRPSVVVEGFPKNLTPEMFRDFMAAQKGIDIYLEDMPEIRLAIEKQNKAKLVKVYYSSMRARNLMIAKEMVYEFLASIKD